jgi:2-hydroxy-3-keto-5-methylthiopentenyl-1-phosphate phosphatase
LIQSIRRLGRRWKRTQAGGAQGSAPSTDKRRPRRILPPAPARRLIAVDWDGTITAKDLLQPIAYAFGDAEIVARLDRGLNEGTVTLRDEIVGEYATVRAPLDEVLEWAFERTRIRPGFRELVELARERGWRLVVVSSGFHELIEPVLEREGIEVEVHANRVDPRPDGWRVEWRYDDGCDACGQSCKRPTAERLARGEELVYIGDGYSDRCAGEYADRVFATRRLATHLGEKGIPYEPFDDFFEIAQALTSGRKTTRRTTGSGTATRSSC